MHLFNLCLSVMLVIIYIRTYSFFLLSEGRVLTGGDVISVPTVGVPPHVGASVTGEAVLGMGVLNWTQVSENFSKSDNNNVVKHLRVGCYHSFCWREGRLLAVRCDRVVHSRRGGIQRYD